MGRLVGVAVGLLVVACGGSSDDGLFGADLGSDAGSGGAAQQTGGATSSDGGALGSGGAQGCSTDLDCKGERVCERGSCVALSGSGGATGSGGAPVSTGGAVTSGGAQATGGTASGGALATGGATASGGQGSGGSGTGGSAACEPFTGRPKSCSKDANCMVPFLGDFGPCVDGCCTGVGPYECKDDEKLCDTQCVLKTDPAFGCSAGGCSPCPEAPDHGHYVCSSGSCLLGCEAGYKVRSKRCVQECETASTCTNSCVPSDMLSGARCCDTGAGVCGCKGDGAFQGTCYL